MAENMHTGASGETAGSWLKPSEALTRFDPGDSLIDRNIRSMEPLRFGVRVVDIGLLIPSGMLSEVVEDAKIYPLPTAPHWFQGLINLRGTLVPIFNLKVLFQIDKPDTEDGTNLLVLNSDDQAAGFLIDGLPMALNVTQSLTQIPLLPAVLREHAHVVYVQDGRVWVEFDFDGLFRTASSLPQT
jgi:twitching motility protein PilI